MYLSNSQITSSSPPPLAGILPGKRPTAPAPPTECASGSNSQRSHTIGEFSCIDTHRGVLRGRPRRRAAVGAARGGAAKGSAGALWCSTRPPATAPGGGTHSDTPGPDSCPRGTRA